MLLGTEPQVLDAARLAVVAGQRGGGLQQRAAPYLLRVLRQGLVIRLAGQRTQWCWDAHVHTQVG